jgi:hypothetical protein
MRSSARFGIGRGRRGLVPRGRIVSVAIVNEQAGLLLMAAVNL